MIKTFEYTLADFDRARWEREMVPILAQVCSHGNGPISQRFMFQLEQPAMARAYEAERIRYVVAFEGDRPRGAVPLVFQGTQDNEPRWEYWQMLGSCFYYAYSPPCPPEVFEQLLPGLPAILDPSSDQDYWRATGLRTRTKSEGWFDLSATFDGWLSSLSAKKRGRHTKNLRDNADCSVHYSREYRPEVVAHLLPDYVRHWEARRAEQFINHARKLELEMSWYERYADDAIFQYVYWPNGRPAAMNVAWTPGHRVIDSLCLRDMSEAARARGFGIFVVLNQLRWAIENGYTEYTLGAGCESYKRQFDTGNQSNSVLVTGSGIDVLVGADNFYHTTGTDSPCFYETALEPANRARAFAQSYPVEGDRAEQVARYQQIASESGFEPIELV